MSLFKFRRGDSAASSSGAAAQQPESAELVRKRAKHRLIGSAVLVLVGVLGFPLLFDTRPRPVAVDIPIEIPGRNTSRPQLPAPPAPAARPVADEKVGADPGLSEKEELLSQKPAEAQTPRAQAATKSEAKVLPRSEPKAEPKTAQPEARPAAKPVPAAAADAARTSTAGARLVVQVGAYSDADKARDVRLRLEKAGLKSYTQVAETKDGKRIRVRVGPFATKAEADKAVSKIKSLDMPAAILAL